LCECEICKSKEKLETHHINFQKDFDSNKINNNLLHIQKDANYNLVTLCSSCHDEVDRNKIVITGWNNTSNGKELDYKKKNNIKKQKYSDDFINYIKLIKNETSDVKFARIKIKEKFNINVTKQLIDKVWA